MTSPMQAEFQLPAYLTTQLEAGGTGDAQQRLHNCLLAAFAVLLTRYSRQDDITVAGVLPGTAQVSQRQASELRQRLHHASAS